MNIEESIETLLKQIEVGGDVKSPNVDQYIRMTILFQQLTSSQNELLRSLKEEEVTELVDYFRNGKSLEQEKAENIHSLNAEEKKAFIEMINEISEQIYLENDRIGHLLTRVLTEYYYKTSQLNIEDWMYNVPPTQQLNFVLLLMSQNIEFGDNKYPDIRFLVHRYMEDIEKESK